MIVILTNILLQRKYYIEWSNVRTQNKYIYDMRRCGGMYKLYGSGNEGIPDASGTIEITIPADGTLYVGAGSNSNLKHGEINASCFDGDWIKVRKD